MNNNNNNNNKNNNGNNNNHNSKQFIRTNKIEIAFRKRERFYCQNEKGRETTSSTRINTRPAKNYTKYYRPKYQER